MQNLSLTRGTSFEFVVQLQEGLGNPYIMQSGEQLIFSVKHFLEHKNYTIQKIATSAEYLPSLKGYKFTLIPEDTANLDADDYFYDVLFQTADGSVYPIIDTSVLSIAASVGKKVVAP